MEIEFYVNGYFNMTFQNVHTGETIQEKDIVLGIMDNLQQGEYLIGMESRTVSSIDDLLTPLYKFNIEPTDSVNYEFEEL